MEMKHIRHPDHPYVRIELKGDQADVDAIVARVFYEYPAAEYGTRVKSVRDEDGETVTILTHCTERRH